MSLKINIDGIPDLAVGFARSRNFLGGLIALCRGGPGAIFNNNFPSHAFLFTSDAGSMFATEEGSSGLVEDSLDTYTSTSNQIVAIMYWTGWNDPVKKNKALAHLAAVRADGGPRAAYGYGILPYFLPVIGPWFKPSTKTLNNGPEECAEDVAGIHIVDGGADFLPTKLLAPDQLLSIMAFSTECVEIKPIYL